MSKKSSLNVRIDSDVKEHAEMILAALGISASSAINIFYRQIIFNQGLPFKVQVPERLTVDNLTPDELTRELEKGLSDLQAGRVIPASQAFAALREEYGL